MNSLQKVFSSIFIVAFLLLTYNLSAQDTPTPFEQIKRMGRGVNIIGYDPLWRDFDNARFKEKHFKIIKDGGFQTVRINLHAFHHMNEETLKLDETWLSTLDWAIEKSLEQNLMVILDLHNFNEFGVDPETHKPKLMEFWRQIAPRYKDKPSNVIFEILNEPNRKLDAELWDQYYKEALEIIRETNPIRTVIIGPPFWNNINNLNELNLPEDDHNIIATIHYYLPMEFTHQGAPWVEGMKDKSGISWGTDEEKQRVIEDFAMVQKWSEENNRPILLGEFGAYDKGETKYRTAYTSHVARTAESFGWAWTYWQFDSDFIVYDINNDEWNLPIWRALIPKNEN
ncbi:MAG: glycoside hydrolase family 5 protein [Melioribacteraceae bacterium]|nr:glycoside hydrolase family 5 protein [Melioribacteraceae bacterium]MCF8395786.1 glycoside hydrolase family 5 protein [Melioribacteraceae bacterium]